MSTKQKGLLGITAAIQYFTEMQYTVLMPLVDANKYDFVIEDHGKFIRIQAKTSSYVGKLTKGHKVILESRGGAGGKKTRAMQKTDYDVLFVLTDDKRRWVIPVEEITSTTGLTVGTKKYADWEIIR